MDHQTWLERAADILSKIGGFLLGLVAIIGMMRGIPKLLNHGKVVSELMEEREARKTAENAAKDYREAAERARETAETYRALYEADKVRADEAVERAETAADRADSAVVFIVDLLHFIKSGRPITEAPPVPEDLEQAVYRTIEKRKSREVAKEHEPPFSIAPEQDA